MNPGLYLVIKFAAYCCWCYLGLRMFRPGQSGLVRALGFGAIRLFLGFFFGVCIFFLSLFWGRLFDSPGLPQNVLTYLFAYVPVRWIEWTIMALLLNRILRGTPRWFVGKDNRDRLWRVGGIVISCLADIPFIEAFNGPIPTGRFLC